jgi:sulfotransferase
VKDYVFLAGMPRSGSTLLSSLLNQHPDVYASTNSAALELVVSWEQQLSEIEQFRANPNPVVLSNVMRSAFEGFYAHRGERVIVDKSRFAGQPAAVGVIEDYVSSDAKFICMLRPTLEVLTSFIVLMRANPIGASSVDLGLDPLAGFLDDRRCDRLMDKYGVIQQGIRSIENLRRPEFEGRVFFVSYDDLVSDAAGVMSGLTGFLGVDDFVFDFDNVVNSEVERDVDVYGLAGMHDVRSSVGSVSRRPEDVLSEYVRSKYNFGGVL